MLNQRFWYMPNVEFTRPRAVSTVFQGLQGEGLANELTGPPCAIVLSKGGDGSGGTLLGPCLQFTYSYLRCISYGNLPTKVSSLLIVKQSLKMGQGFLGPELFKGVY
jgi:hypothetical protein